MGSDMKRLAAAEGEANDIIKAARDDRIRRIADAKHEAQDKLGLIEEEQEKLYNDQKEMSMGGSKEQIEAELKKEGDKEMAALAKEFDENRSKVVSMLHNVVVNVTYDLHDTLKKEEEEVDTKTD